MAEQKYVDWDGLQYYHGKITQYIQDEAEVYLKSGGEVSSIEELPRPSFEYLNYVFKINKDFTSTEDFQLPGYNYASGTSVICADLDKDGTYRYHIFVEAIKSNTELVNDLKNLKDKTDDIEAEIDTLPTVGYVDNKVSDEHNFIVHNYALKSEIPDISNLATEEFVKGAVANVTVDTSKFATYDYVDNAIDNISGFVTTEEINDYAKSSKVVSLETDMKLLDARVDTWAEQTSAAQSLAQTAADDATASRNLSIQNETKITNVQSTISVIDKDVDDIKVKQAVLESNQSYNASNIATNANNISNIRTDLSTLETTVNKKADASVLTGYATKEFVNTSVSNSTKDLATKQEVQNVANNIPSVSEFVTEDEVNTIVNDAVHSIEIPEVDLTGYAKTTEIPVNVSELINDIEYQTATQVAQAIAEAQLDDKEVDLSSYYTADQTHQYVEDEIAKITTATIRNDANFTTLATVKQQGYLVNDDIAGKSDIGHTHTLSEIINYEEPDLSAYALKSDLDSFVTDTELESKGYLTEHQDISGKADREHKHSISDITDYQEPDLSNLATKDDLANFITAIPDEYITEEELNLKGYITEHQSLAEYAKLTDIPTAVSSLENDSNYATQSFVTSEIAKANLSGGDITEEELNNLLSNYYNKTEVDSLIPSLDGYAKEADLFSGSYNDLTDKPIIPSTQGLASEEWVTNKNYLTQETYNAEKTEFALKSDLFSKSYNDLTDKPDIPSVEGLASTEYVDEQISNVVIPEIPTNVSAFNNDAGYVTDISSKVDKDVYEIEKESFVTTTKLSDALITKADDVLFTSKAIVNNAVGTLSVGDDISGLTLKDIITRMLNIVESVIVTIEEVKASAIPVYQGGVDDEGTKTEDQASTFAYVQLTEEEYSEAPQAADPGTSALYEIVDDNGDVVEHGYQVYTVATGRGVYWRVSIAEGLTIKDVLMWDPITTAWVDYTPVFEDTGERIQNNGYTYVVYQSTDTANEEILRIIIE